MSIVFPPDDRSNSVDLKTFDVTYLQYQIYVYYDNVIVVDFSSNLYVNSPSIAFRLKLTSVRDEVTMTAIG